MSVALGRVFAGSFSPIARIRYCRQDCALVWQAPLRHTMKATLKTGSPHTGVVRRGPGRGEQHRPLDPSQRLYRYEVIDMNMQINPAATANIPDTGLVVFSEQMHPIYDAVAEIRLMPDGKYQIWHHYGDVEFAWADETSRPTLDKEEALDQVRAYQRVFIDSKAAPVADVENKRRWPRKMYVAA